MRLCHGTSVENAYSILATGVSTERCFQFFTTFDLDEAYDIYAPFDANGNTREPAVILIDIDEQTIKKLLQAGHAKKLEWGFREWIIFGKEAFDMLNQKAHFPLVPEGDS